MYCLKCGKESLVGILRHTIVLDMNQQGGSVNVSGVRVTQKELKDAWDKDEAGDPRLVRGPIVCLDCDAAHYYIKGANPSLRLGSYHAAIEKSLKELLEEGLTG